MGKPSMFLVFFETSMFLATIYFGALWRFNYKEKKAPSGLKILESNNLAKT